VAVRVDVQPGVGQQAGHEPGRDVVHVGASSPVGHPGTAPAREPVRRGLSAIGDAVPVVAPGERASPSGIVFRSEYVQVFVRPHVQQIVPRSSLSVCDQVAQELLSPIWPISGDAGCAASICLSEFPASPTYAAVSCPSAMSRALPPNRPRAGTAAWPRAACIISVVRSPGALSTTSSAFAAAAIGT